MGRAVTKGALFSVRWRKGEEEIKEEFQGAGGEEWRGEKRRGVRVAASSSVLAETPCLHVAPYQRHLMLEWVA